MLDDLGLSPDVTDQKHQVIPIITGGDDDTVEEVQLPEILPILTLRSSVLFPGAITPITVGREKSIALVRAVQAENGLLGAVLQKNAEIETPTPDDMYRSSHPQDSRDAEWQPYGYPLGLGEDRGGRVYLDRAFLQGKGYSVARLDTREEQRGV